MKLETFFEKFDQFADAPDAVAKMRELVLHLAFSGKLLPTAESWPLTPLKSLATKIGSGATPAGGRESYFTEGIPLIRSMNVHFAGFEPKGLVFLSDEQAKQLANVTVQPCDVLLNITGASIGRVTTAPAEMAGGRVNQHVAIIRPIKELDAQFLAKFLASPAIQRMIDDVQVGATREALTKAMIEQFEIPLPPLAEQKRIVAKVDELMALCDRLESQQQERETRHAALARASLSRFADAPTPANLHFLFHPSYAISPADLRKSILTLAVQGKLVPQDPNDEPAEDTLVKVLRARERQEKSLRIKEPTPVEADAEHTPDLPSGWCCASPDQLTAFHKNALTIGPFGSSLLKSDYTDEGVPLVFVRDIRSESFGGPETRFVTADKADELASHTVRPGDLLITKMGDPPGDTAIYPDGRPPAIITADCIKLTPHSDVVSAEYLRFTIRASQIAEQFAGITLGVAQQKVSLGRFRCIAVPIPPLAEQRRIVAKVSELMALVDALESQLTTSRATAENLLAAVVAELTEGTHVSPAC
jgi:type I restriction enzyme, S subunit